MKLRNLIVTTVAAMAVASSSMTIASAQEEREGRGRPEGGRPQGGRFEGGRFGGPGGPGGPGGMMRMGARGGAANLVMLLGREEVRTEIKLMPDQVEGLRKMAERMRGERPDFDFRNASDEERAAYIAKMQAQQAERAADAKAQLEELLLPNQFERLEQIALQTQGAMALLNPEVAEKLGVTKEVTEAMNKDVTASQEKGGELVQTLMRERTREAGEAMREKMEEMRKDLESKLVAHLSDDQKKKFEEMKGEPFELAQRPFGGPGFGGPGGPGGFGGDRGPGPGGERGGPEGRERGGRERGNRERSERQPD